MVETILENLIFNGTYFTHVWPHLKPDYFDRGPYLTTYNLIKEHVNEYNNIPTKTALGIALDKKSLSPGEYDATKELISKMSSKPEDLDWLVKETESYCKDKAMFNAISRSIEIQENAQKPVGERDKRMPGPGAIQDLMAEALSISFDSSVGHDWFEDYEKRWLLYQSKANKIPFKIEILNKITKGGVELGTLNILLAGTNVGKSLGLCSLAADYVADGKNVLYISMEMAEHVCAKRIDANLLDVSLDDIDDGNISYPEFKARIERVHAKGMGKLVIKQYPTSSANANHFNALINELKLKKNFKPDVIIVDYMGICASSRVNGAENSYTLVKAISEELRALAVSHNVVLWTGAQTTRGGNENSDVNITDVAESFGLMHTADFVLAIMETEELAQMGLQLFKQLKSRYGDKNYINRFSMGVKKGNQRWIEVENDSFRANETPAVEQAQGAMNRQADANRRARLDELASKMQF